MRQAMSRREIVEKYLKEVGTYYGHYHDCENGNCKGIVFKRDTYTNSEFVADACPDCKAVYISRPSDGTFEWNVPNQEKRDKIVHNLMCELFASITRDTGVEPVLFHD